MKSITGHHLLACGMFLLTAHLNAGTRVWDGGGKDGIFSNPLNWDGDASIPMSGTDILQVGVNTAGGSPNIGFDNGEFQTPSFTFLGTAVSPYTVTTTGSISNFLTLTGTGVALQNLSPVRQTFSVMPTVVAASTQTWDGGAQGLVMARIDLGASQSLTITGSGTLVGTRNEISGGISGTGTSGITKSGAGTLLLNNTDLESDYTGPTILLQGRLQLGRANQIPNGSNLVLSGGVFDTGGFSDTVGALSLAGSVTIDFGSSDTASLYFADSHLQLWSAGTVNIINFTPGADFLRFGSDSNGLTAGQLAQISFNGLQASIDAGGYVQPVPEPGVAAALLIAAGVTAGLHRRRKPSPSA